MPPVLFDDVKHLWCCIMKVKLLNWIGQLVFKELLDEWQVHEVPDVILGMNGYKQMWLGCNIWSSFYNLKILIIEPISWQVRSLIELSFVYDESTWWYWYFAWIIAAAFSNSIDQATTTHTTSSFWNILALMLLAHLETQEQHGLPGWSDYTGRRFGSVQDRGKPVASPSTEKR